MHAAMFFTSKILIVDFKSIKQKTVEIEMGIFKRLFRNVLFLEFCKWSSYTVNVLKDAVMLIIGMSAW